jgi:subtilisin family serine protease
VRRLAAVVFAGVVAIAAPAAATPGPPNSPEYWFDSWHVPTLWASGVRGQGVTIAEIDTGVNAALPELRGKILAGTDLGESGNGQIDREVDGFGHGTAMASIMVARPGLLDITGLAPDAKILPIAVPLDGTTDAGQPDRLPDAIRYAADHHAQIISMSLGGKRSPSVDSQPCNDDEQSAIYYAIRKGALVLASVGNTGPRKNSVEDPGVCLGVLSVGAVDSSGAVASFSGRQPYLTFVAPGVDVPSLGREAGQAYSGSGTSQSTAIASAVAALVWSRYPRLGARGVAARMIATLDGHRSRPDPAYGYGVLDAYRAVTANVPAGAPNPVYADVQPFLARYEAMTTAPGAPRPAAKPIGPTGTFEVGSTPRITPPVITGIALAAAGLALLLVMLGVGVFALRRRRALAAPAQFSWTLADVAGATAEPTPRTARPRPGPGAVAGAPHPRPGPGRGPAR